MGLEVVCVGGLGGRVKGVEEEGLQAAYGAGPGPERKRGLKSVNQACDSSSGRRRPEGDRKADG